MFHDLRGRRVTVMGLGRFGGGVGATRFLVERGARVTVTDLADEETLCDSLAQIADLKLERLRLRAHAEKDFRSADLVVASPAVPPGHPMLAAAQAAGVPVTTEIGLLWALCRGRVIGITGSVGKSTTAAMTHAVIAAAGRRAWLGGNIGGSLLPDVDRITADDWVVLELSSFQLERVAPLRLRPAVAVVTNLRPNHLDRHGSLDDYRAAKQTLLRWQRPDDAAVLNADDADVVNWPTQAVHWWFGSISRSRSTSEGVIDRPSSSGVFVDGPDLLFRDGPSARRLTPALRIPGEHHLLNAAAAAAAAAAIGLTAPEIVHALNTFCGLPHRLRMIGELGGRLWVEDSKATAPESTIAALRTFDRPVRLIAGGADKGADLSPLADEIARRDVRAYLSGRTGPTIAALLKDRHHFGCAVYESFDASVAAAYAESSHGDVILLSPACASWGQFRDYRERGARFAEIAAELLQSDESRSRR